MAFPELPDDRRARPRRYRGSADAVSDPVEGGAGPSDDPRGNGHVTTPRGPGDRPYADDPAGSRRRAADDPGGRRRASTETGRHAAGTSTAHDVDDRRPGNGYHPAGGNGNGHGNGGYRDDERPVERIRDAYPFDGSAPDRSARLDARRRDPADSGPPDGTRYDDAWYNRPLAGDPRYDGSLDGGDPSGGDPSGRNPRGRDLNGGDTRNGDEQRYPRGGDVRNGDPRGAGPSGRDPSGGDPLYGNPFGGDPRGGDPLYGGAGYDGAGYDGSQYDSRYDDQGRGTPRNGDLRTGHPRNGDPGAPGNGNLGYPGPRGGDAGHGDPRTGPSAYGDPRTGDRGYGDPRAGDAGSPRSRNGVSGYGEPGYGSPRADDAGTPRSRNGDAGYGDPRNGDGAPQGGGTGRYGGTAPGEPLGDPRGTRNGDAGNGSGGTDRAERRRYAEPDDPPRRRDGRAGEAFGSDAPDGGGPPTAGPGTRAPAYPAERPDRTRHGSGAATRRPGDQDGRDLPPETTGRFRDDDSRRAGPPADGRDPRRSAQADEWDDPQSRRTRVPEQSRRRPEAGTSADLDGAAPSRPADGRPDRRADDRRADDRRADDRRADDRRAARPSGDGLADTTRRVRRDPDAGRPSTPGRTAPPVPVPSDDPEPETDGVPIQDDVADAETRAIPVRRRGDPDASDARELPGDDTTVRTPARRRRPAGPADEPDDRLLDRGEPDDDLNDEGADDEAAGGPRDPERGGPGGIGGKLARLRSRRTGPDGTKKPTSFWKELPLLVGVALVLTFLIQTFVAKVFVIPSGSMETTLHGCSGCTNDRVLVDKVTYNFTSIAPGDVVVFRGPPGWSDPEYETEKSTNPVVRGLETAGSLIGFAPPDEEDFVKRVIAVGGQTVACCDALNQVMVDGQPLDEPYLYYLPEAGPARQIPFGPVKVPDGDLFVMGDSRNNSADARIHGPVPEDNVIGKVRLIVIPFNRFGWVDAVNPQTTASAAGAAGLPQGTPLALGMMGTFPLAWSRRRTLRLRAEEQRFLPAVRRPRRSRRRA